MSYKQNGKQKALGVVVLLAGFFLILGGLATNAIYLIILGVFSIGALLGYIQGFRQAKLMRVNSSITT